MALPAGRLRNRVDVVRPTETRNGKGGWLTTFPAIATAVPAEVLGLTGSEAVIDKVLRGIRVYRVTIRWRPDLLPSDQLRYGADDLNIRSMVDPDGRAEQLLIVADTDGAQSTAIAPEGIDGD